MTSSEKTINFVRWLTRITSILIATVFLAFFVGETDFSSPFSLAIGEVFMLICIPMLLIVSMVIAWKKEMLGGIMIVACVLLFNIFSMIFYRGFTLELEFGLFVVVGFGYIICGFAKKRLES